MSENESVVQGMLESANRQDAAAIHSYLAEAMHAVNPKIGASAASRMHAAQSALLVGFPDLSIRLIELSLRVIRLSSSARFRARIWEALRALAQPTKGSSSQPLSAFRLTVES